MEFRIDGNPDFGELSVALCPGEKVIAESGAMTRMSGNMETRASLAGGLIRGLARKLLGGESFFLAQYAAPDVGWVVLAPRLPGQVHHHRLQGEDLLVTAGAFLACSPGIDIRTRFMGLKGLFSGKGAFLLRCSGQGDLYTNAYGALVEKEVDGSLVVDTGHATAWTPGLDWSLTGMGSLKSTFLSGEGLTLRFSGRGTVWLQTRTMPGIAGWLRPWCRG
jgi:uncharacterized protein (TIGR00266 family)